MDVLPSVLIRKKEALGGGLQPTCDGLQVMAAGCQQLISIVQMLTVVKRFDIETWMAPSGVF